MKILKNGPVGRAPEGSGPEPVRGESRDGGAVVESLPSGGISAEELTPRVRRAMAMLLAEVDQLRGELGDARARIDYLERLADEDPLMPIANRRAFLREVTRMVGFARRYGTTASIVFADVNRLKAINDSYGHAAGDAALLQVSRTLVEHVRTTDVVARLGGDEFGVLLVQTDQQVAETKAEQLAQTVRANPLSWQGQTIPLDIAYGVYTFGGDAEAGQALDAADRAMYLRKPRPGVER